MFQITLAWEATKDWLAGTLGLTHHDLHLMLGVLLTLTFTWLLRLPLGSWTPLLIVLGLELVNEASDFARYYLSSWPWVPGPTLIDIALTIVPSLVIVLAARWRSPDFYRFRRRLKIHAEITTANPKG